MSGFLYNVAATYEKNCEEGPVFKGEIPERKFSDERFDFLGFPVASRVGIPAGPLLNAKWAELAFKTGSDICFYKTIRSEERKVNGFPNVCFLETPRMFDPKNPPKILNTRDHLPENRAQVSITNSFGMPSKGEAYLREDIPRAANYANEGQVLVVSVVGTSKEDFIEAAMLAKRCGAKVIEANFSCPNVCSKEGQLYLDPHAVETMGKEIVVALKGTPLIIKVGRFDSKDLLEKVLIAMDKVGIGAVSGINTVSVEIRTAKDELALDNKRPTSGVCGFAIRDTALLFAKDAREVITKHNLQLQLLAGGGITEPHHFDEFLKYADFAMCATGWFNDPYIFSKWHAINTRS